jgi:hypothetical protein
VPLPYVNSHLCQQAKLRESVLRPPVRSPVPAPALHSQQEPLYVIVFGYPVERYELTLQFFRSLGDSTEAEEVGEIVNAFRIGYRNPGEAMRAVRKNGEILAGSWMIGAKWAVRVVYFFKFELLEANRGCFYVGSRRGRADTRRLCYAQWRPWPACTFGVFGGYTRRVDGHGRRATVNSACRA